MKRRFEESATYFDALTRQWLEGTRKVFRELPPLEWWSKRGRIQAFGRMVSPPVCAVANRRHLRMEMQSLVAGVWPFCAPRPTQGRMSAPLPSQTAIIAAGSGRRVLDQSLQRQATPDPGPSDRQNSMRAGVPLHSLELGGQRAMPLENQLGHRWPAPLADRVPDGADAEEVADAIVAVWQEIDQALHPIIGHRGVAALYNRSLNLTAAAYPWLAVDLPAVPAAFDPSELRAALVQQAAAEATAGGNALFLRFHELLASLVGPSLTERLLRSVWTHPSGTSPAQDTSS